MPNLVEHSGDFNTTYDGQVVEGMHITGAVNVRNKNVIVRDNRIEFGVWAVPDSTHPSVSASVEWNTIGSTYGDNSHYIAGNGRGENLTFYRNEIFGGIDLFNFYYSGNVTIQENWAYGPFQWLSDPFQNGGLSHDDGIQVHKGGAHYHVIRNRFDLFLFRGYTWDSTGTVQLPIVPAPDAKSDLGRFYNIAPMTTGFLFQQTNGPLDDIVFDGNHIDGDYYRVFSFEAGTYASSPTHVKIVNNTIVKRISTFGRSQLIGAFTSGTITWGNNVDQSGTAIPRQSGMLAP